VGERSRKCGRAEGDIEGVGVQRGLPVLIALGIGMEWGVGGATASMVPPVP